MLYIVYMRFQQAMGLSIHLGIEPIFQGFWNKQKGNKQLELNVIPLLFQHMFCEQPEPAQTRWSIMNMQICVYIKKIANGRKALLTLTCCFHIMVSEWVKLTKHNRLISFRGGCSSLSLHYRRGRAAVMLLISNRWITEYIDRTIEFSAQ